MIAREGPSAYRVRGYLAAEIDQDKTTISWVWDVFDGKQQLALRISGSETAKPGQGKGWQAADDAMMQRIAKSSMSELAAFLTSPAVAPGTPGTSGPQVAFTVPTPSTPEAAGIFRIFRPNADPVSGPAPAVVSAAEGPSVPLPRRRPAPATAVSAGETVTLAASRR